MINSIIYWTLIAEEIVLLRRFRTYLVPFVLLILLGCSDMGGGSSAQMGFSGQAGGVIRLVGAVDHNLAESECPA